MTRLEYLAKLEPHKAKIILLELIEKANQFELSYCSNCEGCKLYWHQNHCMAGRAESFNPEDASCTEMLAYYLTDDIIKSDDLTADSVIYGKD